MALSSLFSCFFGRKSASVQLIHTTQPREDSTTIIIGGGIIGLCTAYNLATKCCDSKAPFKKKVIVVEAASSIFKAASSHNTGCLHYHFPESFGEDLEPLGIYCFEEWKSVAQQDGCFVSDSGYRRDSFFPITFASRETEKSLPNWIKGQDWDVAWGSRGKPCATANPEGIGHWLEEKCIAMGVDILTSTTVTAAYLSEKGTIKGVKCCSSKSKESYMLDCSQLVIAAGPWTPSLVETLFPESTLNLDPTTNAGDWIILKDESSPSDNSVSVVFFDNIVQEKLEFAGRNDKTIWACGRRNFAATLPRPGFEDVPDDRVISDLIKYAQDFLQIEPKNANYKEKQTPYASVLAKGRSFRPSTTSGLPLISGVPSKTLSSSPKCTGGPSQVYICYGHGSYGITLGMGSGKLMAQLIQNERPDIDISRFAIF